MLSLFMNKYLLGAVAALAVVGGIYWFGYSAGSDKVSVDVEREKSEVRKHNDKIIREALDAGRTPPAGSGDGELPEADPFRRPD